MKVKNMTAGTLVRTVTLVVALLNLVLTSFGKNPLPFSDEQIYTGLSALVTVAAALAAWWKNNSFTCCARQADEVLRVLQQEGSTEDESVAETLEQEGDWCLHFIIAGRQPLPARAYRTPVRPILIGTAPPAAFIPAVAGFVLP